MLDTYWIPIPSIFTTSPKTHPIQNLCIGEMTPVCHFEVSGKELLEVEPKATELFENIGWGFCFRCFNCHEEGH